MRFLILSILILSSAPGMSADLPPNIGHRLNGLRARYVEAVKTCSALRGQAEESAGASNGVNEEFNARLEEFRDYVKRIGAVKPPPLPRTVSGASLLWSKRARAYLEGAESSQRFDCGPGNAISPWNGEYHDAHTDAELSARGGLSVSFVRRYSSHNQYDCGFGLGWDHDYSAGVVFDGSEIGNAENCCIFWRGREIRFSKVSGSWMPERGQFLRLQISSDDKRVFLLTPMLTRIEFEKAAEQMEGESRWRLCAIASRHDDWQANRIKVEYLEKCDRIKWITGVRGEKIEFSYDDAGHIASIMSLGKQVVYEYAGNLLVRMREKDVALSANTPKLCDYSIEYAYSGKRGHERMIRRTISGQTHHLEIGYDESGRVILCGNVSQDASQLWRFRYSENDTMAEMPKPSASVCWTWGGTPHPSLPCRVSVPAKNETQEFSYNEDFLIVREVGAFGVTTLYGYDTDNPDALMRGNRISERVLAGDADSLAKIPWNEFGVRTRFENDIALPSETIYYQTTTNGIEEIVKRELMYYDPYDRVLVEKRECGGSVKKYTTTRYSCNRFGEIAVEWNGNSVATIYEYCNSSSVDASYSFHEGSCTNGGWLVQKTEGATAEQIRKAFRELRKRVKAKDMASDAFCTLITRYAHDIRGRAIREKCSGREVLHLYNSKGALLAQYTKGAGMIKYEYFPDGRIKTILTQVGESGNRNGYRPQSSMFFDGFYSESIFEYDSLGQLISHVLTDEKIEDSTPVRKFRRLPNGKVAEFVNPSGVTRIDEYDASTGLLLSQSMKGVSGNVPLCKIVERFPGGDVKVYEDRFGAVWTNRIDCFGRMCGGVSSDGTMKCEIKDAFGRVVETCVSNDAKIYSWSHMAYSSKNGKLERRDDWCSNDGVSGNWMEVKRYIYDDAGNEIGFKGVREDSWSIFLHDGLGRRIASLDAVGNCSLCVYDGEVKLCDLTISKCGDASSDYAGQGDEFMQGRFYACDDAGRVCTEFPIDSNARIVHDRATQYSYDEVGKCIRTEFSGLTAHQLRFNSLGWKTGETTIPLDESQGEEPVVVETVYRPDGKPVKRELSNSALVLVGDKSAVRPQQVDAPQVTRYFYDEYGRCVSTVNPDGLRVSTVYDKHSLPASMEWTHETSDCVLRRLDFSFSPYGQIERIYDGSRNQILQEFKYDGVQQMIESIDFNSGECVVCDTEFDSLGECVSTRTSLRDIKFPERRFFYDHAKGIVRATWIRNERDGVFWESETASTDCAGRLCSVYLDDDIASSTEWDYIGALPWHRRENEPSLRSEYAYSPLGEVTHIEISDALTRDEKMCSMEYGYGRQGQSLYSSMRLKNQDGGDEYLFAEYSRFDSFGRLTGQNVEASIAADGNWFNAWSKVLGVSEPTLANQSTMRMRYDSAENIWVKYLGEETSCSANELSVVQSPIFISSAKPVASPFLASKRDLASNREVTSASYFEETLIPEMKEYDDLGNLVEFTGFYRNTSQSYPVKWKLFYDALGRLSQMTAYSNDEGEFAKFGQGTLLATLSFAYDAQNRRIVKRVEDMTMHRHSSSVKSTYTLYNGNRQVLVFDDTDGSVEKTAQFLWGVGERELVMAALSRDGNGNRVRPARHWFKQDRSFNTVAVTKNEQGRNSIVSVSSYLGFGENATSAGITGVSSSMASRDNSHAWNNVRDEVLAATWISGTKSQQFIEIQLRDESRLSSMMLWGTKGMPRDFLVYVLPKGVESPRTRDFLLDEWHRGSREYLVAVSKGGFCSGWQKQDSFYSPYRISLGDFRGDRVVIAWDKEVRENICIGEIEIVRVPENPSPFAFAGQWLDSETGLYYQINRYRIAGSGKFISPDPLGFAAGNNFYAYANANPLDWHDPDGRIAVLAAAGIGAAIGAIASATTYAFQSWMNGDEFSFEEFGIHAFVGALSGAVAGLLLSPALALGVKAGGGALGGAISGAIMGGASGATAGFTDVAIHGWAEGDDFGDTMSESLYGSLKSGLAGMAGGAVGGAVASKIGFNPKSIPRWIRKMAPLNETGQYFMRSAVVSGTSGALGGAAAGAVDGGFTAYETGDSGAVLEGMSNGALYGAVGAVASSTILNAVERGMYGEKWRVKIWDIDRKEYWKNEAQSNGASYSAENLERMRQGKAPQRFNPASGSFESMELNHQILPRSSGLPMRLIDTPGNLKPMWPDEHSSFHRHFGYGKWK